MECILKVKLSLPPFTTYLYVVRYKLLRCGGKDSSLKAYDAMWNGK